jgi:adenylate kinase family enzyme
MQRIAIIGCGGSGKSTLAKALGALLGLPVHHLDRLYWKPGWVEPPAAHWAALQNELCRQPAWIIDGNYGGTLEIRLAAADTIVFLDLPTRVCLWGALRRFLTYRGRTRPDMSEGCQEKLDWQYLRWIATYRSTRRRQIMQRLYPMSGAKRIAVLSSRRAVARFLQDLAAES